MVDRASGGRAQVRFVTTTSFEGNNDDTAKRSSFASPGALGVSPSCTPVLSDIPSSTRVYVNEELAVGSTQSSGFLVLGADPVSEDSVVGEAKPISCFHASLGCLHARRWVASAKNKLWWMTPSWGTHGGEVPLETQFLLVELEGDGGQRHNDDQRNGRDGRDGRDGRGDERSESGVYACLLPLICDSSFSGMLVGGQQLGSKKRSARTGQTNIWYVMIRI